MYSWWGVSDRGSSTSYLESKGPIFSSPTPMLLLVHLFPEKMQPHKGTATLMLTNWGFINYSNICLHLATTDMDDAYSACRIFPPKCLGRAQLGSGITPGHAGVSSGVAISSGRDRNWILQSLGLCLQVKCHFSVPSTKSSCRLIYMYSFD